MKKSLKTSINAAGFTVTLNNATNDFADGAGAGELDVAGSVITIRDTDAVNPDQRGTKCAAYGLMMIPGRQSREIRLRLAHVDEPLIADQGGETAAFPSAAFGEAFNECFAERIREADEFYEQVMGPLLFPALNDFLDRFDLLGAEGARLVYITELRSRGHGFELGARELVGLQGERMEPIPVAPDEAEKVEPNRCAVLWPTLRLVCCWSDSWGSCWQIGISGGVSWLSFSSSRSFC